MCISLKCTTPHIQKYGMKYLIMFKITTTKPFVSLLVIALLKCSQGFNQWNQLKYSTHHTRRIHPSSNCRLIGKPNLFKISRTSTNKSIIFYRNPMPSTWSNMIKINFHTSSSWEIRYGCIFIKNSSWDPIGSLST